jgi:hypothetical protein
MDHSISWTHLDDPQYWRERADEARYVAQHMTDPMSREMVLDIAATYERVAQRGEQRRTSVSFGSKDSG